eukprot:CAMPEP_0119371406 /NCGR_PEP_ID=MMETSP1334-20130426/17572_1 /TAXON_ID=127549 /ORGANISM="Calcidiscus leptoporus, Strain RCC1130" /LENGTH=102 /DNA_ID=CAMNT_0007388663 /DNA_START=648 /DNA_END=956 /DNA_ORIENTATION=-
MTRPSSPYCLAKSTALLLSVVTYTPGPSIPLDEGLKPEPMIESAANLDVPWYTLVPGPPDLDAVTAFEYATALLTGRPPPVYVLAPVAAYAAGLCTGAPDAV